MSLLEILGKAMADYCEKGVGIFSTQPVNALSNLFFFLSAYFSHRCVKAKTTDNLLLKTLPFVIALIGVGSALWHSIPTPITVLGDILPIALFVILSLFFMLDRILPGRGLAYLILSVFILIEIFFIFNILPSLNGLMPYAVMILFSIPVFFIFAKKYKRFNRILPILLMFFVALIFRTLDKSMCVTFSTGTHFLWHIINACVFYLLVMLFTGIEKTA